LPFSPARLVVIVPAAVLTSSDPLTVLLRRALPLALLLLVARPAGAQGQPPAPKAALPRDLVEARVLLALPAALPTGMMTGVDAAFTRSWRRFFAWGVRASWATATEYTLSWSVRDDDIRLRAVAMLHHPIGRATLALRLGLGGTVVHEGRARSQGARAGLTGDALETSTWAFLPAVEVEPSVVIRIVGGFGLSLSGGPSLHIVNRHANWGWISAVGISWQR
jgi:hypothetical protein